MCVYVFVFRSLNLKRTANSNKKQWKASSISSRVLLTRGSTSAKSSTCSNGKVSPSKSLGVCVLGVCVCVFV